MSTCLRSGHPPSFLALPSGCASNASTLAYACLSNSFMDPT